MPGGKIRLGEDREEMRVARVCDKGLAAVDYVSSALLVGARLYTRSDRARVGFSDSLRAELALSARPLTEPIGFLLVITGDQDGQHR